MISDGENLDSRIWRMEKPDSCRRVMCASSPTRFGILKVARCEFITKRLKKWQAG